MPAQHFKMNRRAYLLFAVPFVVILFISLQHTRLAMSLRSQPYGQHVPLIMSDSDRLPEYFDLSGGDRVPSLAFGTGCRENCTMLVQTALKSGIRHLDCAFVYNNEKAVGEAIKASNISRSDVWITSKLWNSYHNPEDVLPSLQMSLDRLGVDYLDLYLLHFPVAFVPSTEGVQIDWDATNNSIKTWRAMEELVMKGKVRNIGVSNFNILRLRNLMDNKLRIPPAVNEVEINFWMPQPELVMWARENGILLEAYSALGGRRAKETLTVPEIQYIASVTGMTPAQVMLSWHVQRGYVAISKSTVPARIEENFKVHQLSREHFEMIERAALSHPPQRGVDPGPSWGVDIFEDH